ncbi:MAG TPA: threonine synthase [Flavitalea sp.]|nr:threonine synthase [Flavitalea sp.]
MKYYSTNRQSPKADFRTAALTGQPSDKGLYFPEEIPFLERKMIREIKNISKEEIAWNLLTSYTVGSIPPDVLKNMIDAAFDFDFPLVRVNEDTFSLELFHGPTLAFKDVGARFLSQCFSYFMQHENQKTVILVATSGDTGGAVANAFSNINGVEVVILYPAGKVSEVQEWQLISCGDNVKALRISGNFDDCQRMVKEAFADPLLDEKLSLTSANSINIARWLPQQVYYLDALRQWEFPELPVVSVPCGNLGNIGAGLLAMRSARLDVPFIAACNANKAMYDYLTTGQYYPASTVVTVSNAMDVGAPSNFSRIMEMFPGGSRELKETLSSYTITDAQTIKLIQEEVAGSGYHLDPHGAVAFAALQKHRKGAKQKGIFLETAHPVKFPEVTGGMRGSEEMLPDAIRILKDRKKNFTSLSGNYSDLRDFLLSMEKN